MGSPLQYKVYVGKEYRAATRYAEDAAAVIAATGDATVKWQGRVVYRATDGGREAANSYDRVAQIIRENAYKVALGVKGRLA